METETDPSQMSLKWFWIWRNAFLRPTINTFSRIISHPKASTKWGITWMAISAFIFWFVGPQRQLLSAIVADQFGLHTLFYFLLIGSIPATILGVIGLLINAAIVHGFSRLFNGAGTFHHLFYCWAVMQLPFILISGLLLNLPSIFPSSRELTFSTVGIIFNTTTLLTAAGVILYLIYAEVVAFSAVEKFRIGKGFSILILLAVIVGIVGYSLSSCYQIVMINFFR